MIKRMLNYGIKRLAIPLHTQHLARDSLQIIRRVHYYLTFLNSGNIRSRSDFTHVENKRYARNFGEFWSFLYPRDSFFRVGWDYHYLYPPVLPKKKKTAHEVSAKKTKIAYSISRLPSVFLVVVNSQSAAPNNDCAIIQIGVRLQSREGGFFGFSVPEDNFDRFHTYNIHNFF